MSDQKITSDIAQILGDVSFNEDGTIATLPGQLDRDTYDTVNKLLQMMGGAWKKNKGGHVFDRDVRVLFRTCMDNLLVPDFKKARQAFYTPDDVALEIVGQHWVEGIRILEPSAGGGALARACRHHGASSVFCYEIDPFECDNLRSQGLEVEQRDFLTVEPERRYDMVVMNPPFSKGADYRHVDHALKFIVPHGRLVSIVSPSFNVLKLQEYARTYGYQSVRVEELEAGTFKESGTGIATQVLIIRLGAFSETQKKDMFDRLAYQAQVEIVHGDPGNRLCELAADPLRLQECKREVEREVKSYVQTQYRGHKAEKSLQIITDEDMEEIRKAAIASVLYYYGIWHPN